MPCTCQPAFAGLREFIRSFEARRDSCDLGWSGWLLGMKVEPYIEWCSFVMCFFLQPHFSLFQIVSNALLQTILYFRRVGTLSYPQHGKVATPLWSKISSLTSASSAQRALLLQGLEQMDRSSLGAIVIWEARWVAVLRRLKVVQVACLFHDLMTTKGRVFQEGFAKVLKRLPIPRVRWVRNHPWLQRWTTNGAGTYSKCIAFGVLSVSICSIDQWRDCGDVGRCPLWWKFWWCFRATKGGSGDRSKDSLSFLIYHVKCWNSAQCTLCLRVFCIFCCCQ